MCRVNICSSASARAVGHRDTSRSTPDGVSDGLLQALEKYNVEKDIAAFIKKEFDKKYNPTWHCIVGRNFGKQDWREQLTPLCPKL